MIDYSELFTMDRCRLDDLALEERKIEVAHQGYLLYRQKHWFGDDGWHNLLAFLINRVEQKSNYELIVTYDEEDLYHPNFKIRDRKEYLKERYGIDWVNKSIRASKT